MKKTFLFLFLLNSLFANQIIELAGDKSYPPYSYEENGEAKGVYVDIIKSAFDKIDSYDVKFNMMAWKRAKTLVKNGKIIGFFPPYYSKERTKWTKFSEPILAETSVVFAKQSTLKNRKNFPDDFFNLTMCLNRGFSAYTQGGKALKKAVDEKKIKFIEANDNKACLNRVSREMVDFYINDTLINTSQFKDIIRGPVSKENFGHIGFTLKNKKYPFLKDFEHKLNEVIVNMKKNGEIEKIVKNYK